MKPRLLGIVLLATVSAAAWAQSGSIVGSNSGGSASANIPAPLPVPSTGTSADAAGARGTSPSASETYGETSVAAPGIEGTVRASGRCDTLMGQERTRCLREQASTGTTGPTSTGASSGGTR